MHLQYISNPTGEITAVIIPIEEWNQLLESRPDLKQRVYPDKPRVTFGDFAGILSKEHGDELLQHVEQSRNEWDRDS